MKHGFLDETARSSEIYQGQMGNIVRKEDEGMRRMLQYNMTQKGVRNIHIGKVWRFFARWGEHPLHGYIRVHFETITHDDQNFWDNTESHTIDAPDSETATAMILLARI